MRITAGEFRGRILQVPKGDAIRPTSDRTRQAIFNIIFSGNWLEDGEEFDLEGAAVLDVFCGTGALGLEAISRGAESCTFIDKDRTSIECAKANAEMLKLGSRASFILREAAKIGPKPVALQPARMVFVDPPYRKDLVPPALLALSDGGWIETGAVVIVETESTIAGNDLVNLPFELRDTRPYGDTLIRILRKI
ncbi:MAG: rRNA ((966)-N(2))-methyltransferase RsmD [Micavibrio sp.]|nr:rRNA ((966)-N(2))-methyltransferase RsmD [Micavibrio sp.]